MNLVLGQLVKIRQPTILASFAGNYKKCTRVKIKHSGRGHFQHFEGEFWFRLVL